MVHAKRRDAKVQKFHFLKKLPGEFTGVSNSSVALCLHKGARGKVEVKVRDALMKLAYARSVLCLHLSCACLGHLTNTATMAPQCAR